VTFPPGVHSELEGWNLAWFRLIPTNEGSEGLDLLCTDEVVASCQAFADRDISEHPVVQAVRRLFRAAGCDPTRHRPSSEALLRRILKGGELPRISPLVDLNNLLSLHLLVPACVVDAASLRPPLVLRAGEEGETLLSMRGPFNLAGKPVLADTEGPFGTPITDAERVKVIDSTTEVWLVAYQPADVLESDAAERVLQRFLGVAPVANIVGSS
jgi:DNA/RNA-binding domain of Phe-tRNA-synthetase-like protein